MTESTRAWLYRGALVLIAIAVIFGYMTDEQAGQITAVIAGFLGVGLATANTSTKKKELHRGPRQD